MTTVTYSGKIPFFQRRPYADVMFVSGTTGSGPTYKCLVDTGADYLQLPISAAAFSGISLHGATSRTVITVAGPTSLKLVKNVDVSIEGYIVTVDVLFDPSNSSPPIAGRQLLLGAFDIGFNLTEWLRT